MSQASTDIADLGGIISDFFDGKADIAATNTALGKLGNLVGQQIKTDANEVISILPAPVVQAFQVGLPAFAAAAEDALTIAGDDLQPYLAGGAKAVEQAVDNVISAAVGPVAGTGLNLLVNGGIDTIGAGLLAALNAQLSAWKAKLAANTGSPVPASTPNPTPPSA